MYTGWILVGWLDELMDNYRVNDWIDGHGWMDDRMVGWMNTG